MNFKVFLAFICYISHLRQQCEGKKKQDLPASAEPSVILTTQDVTDTVSNTPTLDEIKTVLDETYEFANQPASQLRHILPAAGKTIGNRIYDLLAYKPPVGVVSVWVISHLIISGRLFRMYKKRQTVEDVLDDFPQRYAKRAYSLDRGDVQYPQHGGAMHTQQRLLQVALNHIIETESADALTLELVDSLAQGLDVNFQGSKLEMAQQLIRAFADSEDFRRGFHQSSTAATAENRGTELHGIVEMAALTVEIRFTDALLRATRDRILQTTYRLARTREHWERKVNNNGSRLFWGRARVSPVGDRVRLEYARAAERSELERLGCIVALLKRCPADWSEQFLLEALQATDDIRAKKKAEDRSRFSWSWLWKNASSFSAWKNATHVARLNKYSLRWQPGSGLQLRRQTFSNLDGNSALSVTKKAIKEAGTKYQTAARKWCQDGHQTLGAVIPDTLAASSAPNATSPSNTNLPYTHSEFVEIQDIWCGNRKARTKSTSLEHSLQRVLRYVDRIPEWRRVGEAKTVRFKQLSGVRFIRRFNVFGIPGSVALIVLAHKANIVVAPHLPTLQQEIVQIYRKTLEILLARIWIPLKGIYDDVMNRNPGLFSAFGLEAEQVSLDHMLRDMGYGDGTAMTRQQALEKASMQYEETLKSGVVLNAVRGRLAQQLLVQVQQLKVGMLTALDTIDALLKGNRIHFQILAAIPAAFVITFGARLFIRLLYNLRAKDVRPLFAVHGEMTTYLDKLEQHLVSPVGNGDLSNVALGELSLLVHRYLILLDFASPPFPSRSRDTIQEFLQELVSNRDPREWLYVVQAKNRELSKYL